MPHRAATKRADAKSARVIAQLMAVQGFPVNQSIAASAAVGATLVVALLSDATNGATTRVAPTAAMLEDALVRAARTL